MVTRRERVEIMISGGRPWGFSVKGGKESNKPLVISKLENGGKAERGGLFVGDVIYSINNVLLNGMRNEAIQLVKNCGRNLTVEVERGMLARDTRGIHQPAPQSALHHHKDYYNRSPVFMQDPYSEDYTTASVTHPDARADDVFHSDYPEQSYKDLNLSLSSLNEEFSTPHDVAMYKDAATSGVPKSDVEVESHNRTGLNKNAVGDSIPQPVVKLRTRKARDKSKPIERPRSWHASKHPDPAFPSEETTMRSPAGGYYQQPLAKPRPRSKGWYESGDLKSAYKGEVNGSKDSLISGSSQRSYKSGRLSVSSSKSSGTMSSSRGSLDNLIESNYSSRLENYPQIFVGNERYKESSPSKPQTGIVSQQKNIFERLSHESSASSAQQHRRGSRDESGKFNRARGLSSDDPDRERRNSTHRKENSRSPSYCGGSRRSSFSPTSMVTVVETEGDRFRKSSHDRDSSHPYQPASSEFEREHADSHSSVTHRQNTPEPPQRDKSSVQAVKNYHSRSHSGNSQEEPASRSPSRGHSSHSAAHPASSPSPYADAPHKLTVTRPMDKSIDTSVSSVRQERVFGVMSVGSSKNIVAASVTVSPKAKEDADKPSSDSNNKSSKPARYELLKDSHSTKETKSQSSSPRQVFEHHKSGSAELNDSASPRGKGKYGSVWNTPQNHRRARSQDFSTVLQDWETRKSGYAEQPKLSLFKPKNSDNVHPVNSHNSEPKGNLIDGKPTDVQVDNLPSILRSLQNTQHGDRRYKNFEPKSSSDNYDKIWYTEASPISTEDKGRTSSAKSLSPKENNSTNYKNWKSEYKEVDLDDHADDAYGQQDNYCNNIKDMSRKVLRVTSFTRKDLEVSPSSQTFEQKKKQFQFPSKLARQKQAVLHGRSRSHGNELDDDMEPLSALSRPSDNSLSTPGKPRPKSAGVIRPGSNNYGSDDTTSPSPPSKQGAHPHKRTSIDVRPDVSPSSGGQQEGMKPETRTAVLNFISRKAGRSFDSSELGYCTSSASIHTSHSDETDKRKTKEKDTSLSERRSPKLGSPSDVSNAVQGRESSNSSKTTPTSRRSDQSTSVRKLKNFKETRDKFLHGSSRLTTRTKSTSSLLEEEALEKRSDGSSLICADKSASLENLTDSGLDMSRASPTGNIEHISPPARDRSKSSPNIEPLLGHYESRLSGSFAHVPPRKHAKHHRQRHSNSSNASSATTISTLSSFSSSSSTSMGRFPALGEEESERLSPPPESPEPQPLPEPQTETSLPTNADPSESTGPVARVPIDTGTYRVARRKGAGKSHPNKSVVNIDPEAPLRPTKEGAVSPPKATNNASDAPKALVPTPTPPVPRPIKVLPKEQEKVDRIIEKVKRSASFCDANLLAPPTKALPPPPPQSPLDGTSEQLLSEIVQRRLDNDMPPPPSVPKKTFDPDTSSLVLRDSEEVDVEQKMASPAAVASKDDPAGEREETSKDHDVPKANNRDSSSYENVHLNASIKSYENVFPTGQASTNKPQQLTSETSTEDSKKKAEKSDSEAENVETKKSEVTSPSSSPPEISPEPLLPDISLLTEQSSLQEQHPDLTRDIIKGDKALAQVLTSSNKKALDYMAGVLAQPSHDIIEEGMRYRRRKPTLTPSKPPASDKENLIPSSITDASCHDNLPASSTYYKTSASKAKILNLVKEKFAEGEIPLENQETLEDINRKKIELVLSIKEKLADLQSMKGLLDVEMRENECLGKHVHDLTKSACTQREQEKYNIFVQDVDKIINLLLSLSGRLARVENTIQMLPADADKQEMEILCEKRKKLMEQHNEAKQLKENIDRRQKAVSEILAGYFDQEQFADYEHYIKMKSALIMEQRELDDKAKLGQEQMQCLHDSLPEEWQINLDNLMEEQE